MGQSIFEKLWDRHVITGEAFEPQLLYVDLHLIHEVTSPQAFSGLRAAGRKVRRTDLTYGTMDHNTPTVDIFNISDAISKNQIDTLGRNAKEFGVTVATHGSEKQGIVHMVGPEIGQSQPGKIIVCGDSHTATHGAFGAIAFGIGTSEVEHVFATQTIWQSKPKTMKVEFVGQPQHGVYAKDYILALISKYGVDAGVGYAVEFTGEAISELEMEERMTICNMSIEFGAKMGLMNPDEKTYAYVKGREFAPKDFDAAVADWRTLPSDPDANYDKVITIDVSKLAPMVTWGTNPEMGIEFTETFPEIKDFNDERAYHYMDLAPGQRPEEIDLGYVFIGSCTNARLSDLELAAKFVKGKKVSDKLTAIVVPGSRPVKHAAEAIGLDKIFKDAGFEWREPGCSMCLGMNPDQVPEGVHCASTSNRNFEGRQGKNARTHLCSPAMAAAAAIAGKFVDVREIVSEVGA
ncbi:MULTISPECIES: 3-isopropylmalate dehydratase large subunit [unclassified Enterococcus]|uniref:3-isopropylmalate dehydratase large subunit n=1 Tax=unclassified Enterococcus TaxID=2608891 RepID=UPI001551ACE4|nr:MULTISPECIES: 3-isopropylmalate dehydratase large subunit [unclassified Enterococcus]MBS7578061.1 3-isopropylmalate dehydratase large subunit [Enterococcus sp. MMGLQ5-2]MBS7585321.1 3-isopropylmalate dehydratase large subunit [Enterococcus sp. MMGLQ5-1]NPD13178.1 3-isopropylmalate dehydratase large subunit [Enterococcus sp. MMGLQ5-1]NPD37892.1 3-isopropylmalate dehydratase large subunit [Enterococcus sp. MMGLQ5-2]